MAALFITMKYAHTMACTSDLIFLLKPTDKFVGFLTSSKSVYLLNRGFYHEELNIVIDKSCSGFNFWCLCFLLISYLAVKHVNKRRNKILVIPFALFVAYILTLFINTSRIFVSIFVLIHTKGIWENQQHIIHESIGVITNLTFLVLFYILFEKLLTNKIHNEKLT